MIRTIAALDVAYGIGRQGTFAWPRLPSDMRWFRQHTLHTAVLMGRTTYQTFGPFPERENWVATHHPALVHDARPVVDLTAFIANAPENLWVIGGADIYRQTLDLSSELYLTRLAGTFECDAFFPPFEHLFTRIEVSEEVEESGVRFRFEIWRRTPVS